MTIAAAYLTSEGVVFGADSTATQTQKSGGNVQLLNHAQKIYEIGEPAKGRLALCTWGLGRVRDCSHRTISVRVADSISPSTTVSAASQLIAQEVQQAAAGSKLPTTLGYFVGGWNPGTHKPECVEVVFEPGKAASYRNFRLGEAAFRGAPEMFERAFVGMDMRLPDLIFQELQQLIPVPPATLAPALETAIQKALNKIPHGGALDVPLREAIDFINMYMHLTIKAFKFRFGPPVVGGPIEIGFVSTDRYFRWVRHKSFDSAIVQEDSSSS